jgi:hypothetical protein
MRNKVKDSEYFRDKFIKKSIERHGDKYNYEKVIYINSLTKVEIICGIHGSFFVRPDAHVRKVGCPVCNGGIKYDLNNFINKATWKHNGFYDYSEVVYKNSITKIKIKCPNHGVFEMTPSAHLIGSGCSDCSGVKKKDNNIFISQSISKHGYKYDYSLVEYKNNRKKVSILCKEHGLFEQAPKDHINGSGCPKCSNFSVGERLIEEILKDIGLDYNKEKKFDNCVGEFNNRLPFDFHIPDLNLIIEFDGRQHYESVEKFGGEEYLHRIKINDKIKNDWCFKNNIDIIRINYKQVNEGIENIIDYIQNKINEKDNLPKIIKNNKIKSKISCTSKLKICENKIQKSKKEEYLKSSQFLIKGHLMAKKELDKFLFSVYKGVFLKNKKIKNFDFDFYMPDEKIAIKLLSNFKNSEIKEEDIYSNKKRSDITDLKVIHIFSDTYFQKKEIIESRILNLLKTNHTKIGSRKCEIKILSSKESSNFLNKNHIQGNIGSSVKIGLIYKDEIVSVMTFGNKRKNLGSNSKKGEWEMVRFCNKLNTTVIGSASKLFKYFIKNYSPKSIISYADKSWSNNINIYENLKMKKIHESKPSYYYIVGSNRIGRFAYRKDQLLKCGFVDDGTLTEHSICLLNSIFRIYDCGTIKYEWSAE